MTTKTDVPLNEVIANPQTIVSKGKAPMVKNLLAQYLQLGEEEKKIQESRAAVRDLLLSMFEEGSSELVVNGKKMATLSKETRVLLNTELIKRNFPQEKFSDFYVESSVSVFRLTRQARTSS
jgi:hypothetical protein